MSCQWRVKPVSPVVSEATIGLPMVIEVVRQPLGVTSMDQ